MANKLTVSFEGAAATLYVVIRRVSDGYAWNGTAMEAWVNGNIGTYDIPLIDQGGDLYSVTVPAALPRGIEYEAIYYQQLGGAPAITDDLLTRERFVWNGNVDATVIVGDPVWHYADYTAVKHLIGQGNLTIIAAPDGTEDAALVQRCGEWSDAWIDARLSAFGFTAPLADTDAQTRLLLRDISAKLTICQLNRSRALVVVSRSGNTTVAGIDKVMNTWEREANSTLVCIGSGWIKIAATRSSTGPTAAVPAFGTYFVPPLEYWPWR